MYLNLLKSKFKVGDYVITKYSNKTNCNLKGKIVGIEIFYSRAENGIEIIPLYKVRFVNDNKI